MMEAPLPGTTEEKEETSKPKAIERRILVVDLPNSGQAAVKYLKDVDGGRVNVCKLRHKRGIFIRQSS